MMAMNKLGAHCVTPNRGARDDLARRASPPNMSVVGGTIAI
jgi:hypothetical protein